MGRSHRITIKRTSITWQAATRLIFSLSLFVVLLGFTTAQLYRSALDKAAAERMADLTGYYKSRIAQLNRDWELQSRDSHIRIEYTRILEDPDPDNATLRLQAFMTIQDSARRFQHLLIQKQDGTFVFASGKDLSLRKIPLARGILKGHYLDEARNAVYQIYEEPIWLGEAQGMARVAFFYRIDNSLLQSLASPDVTLTLLYDGGPVASSKGRTGIDAFAVQPPSTQGTELRTIPWDADNDARMSLAVQAPIRTLFTMTELATSASLVPILDGVILWFVLGLWLIRQARRIDAMGEAVKEFSREQTLTPQLQTNLEPALQGRRDEIHEVAQAIQTSFLQTVERERERAVEAAQRQLWSSVFHSSGDAIIITDPNRRIVAVNQAFEDKMGYALTDVAGQDPRILSARREGADFYQSMWQQINATGFWTGEMWNRHKDGSEHPKLLSISTVRNIDGAIINYVGYYTDISARKQIETELERHQRHLEELVQARTQALEQANAALQHLASTDPLTGLPNRRTLLERGEVCLGWARRYRTSYSLILLDIDHFKAINDQYGHDVGDRVLCALAKRIQSTLRECDILARWGGEEFIILVPQRARDETCQLAERLRNLIATTDIDPVVDRITASFGVAGDQDGDTLEAVIKLADEALYLAKQDGRNCVRCADALA